MRCLYSFYCWSSYSDMITHTCNSYISETDMGELWWAPGQSGFSYKMIKQQKSLSIPWHVREQSCNIVVLSDVNQTRRNTRCTFSQAKLISHKMRAERRLLPELEKGWGEVEQYVLADKSQKFCYVITQTITTNTVTNCIWKTKLGGLWMPLPWGNDYYLRS